MPIGPDGKVVTRYGNPTPFQRGHKLSTKERRNPCTQALISQLNEVDKKTNREKIDLLCEALIKLALGYNEKRKVVGSDGKSCTVEVTVPPDVTAIRDIFDRVDGKARQQIEAKSDSRHEVVYRSVEEIRNEMAARGITINGEPLELHEVIEDDDDGITS